MTAVSVTSVLVSWSAPNLEVQNGLIRSYSIIVTDSNNETILHVMESTTTIAIDNLEPFSKYYVHIAASTIGIGPFAEPVLIGMLGSSKSHWCISLL